MFAEGKTPADVIVWVNEGQRRIKFVFESEITFKDVKLNRYRMEPGTLLNFSSATTAYDQARAKHYYMINHPRGVASRQRTDSFDSFISKPHFLHGDPDFHGNQLSIALDPNQADHDSYLDIEPLTGRTFAARKRLQLGVYLNRQRIGPVEFGGVYSPLVVNYPGNNYTVENFPGFKWGTAGGQNNLYIPILWAAEGKDIGNDDASSFASNVYGTRKTFFVLQIVLVIVGGLMFFTFLILCIKARQSATSSM
jgi:hypothetical protein